MKTTIQEEKLRNEFAARAADALSKPDSGNFYTDNGAVEQGRLVAVKSKRSIIVFVSASDGFVEYDRAARDSFADALSQVPDQPKT